LVVVTGPDVVRQVTRIGLPGSAGRGFGAPWDTDGDADLEDADFLVDLADAALTGATGGTELVSAMASALSFTGCQPAEKRQDRTAIFRAFWF
jgi:hypothetical protein